MSKIVTGNVELKPDRAIAMLPAIEGAYRQVQESHGTLVLSAAHDWPALKLAAAKLEDVLSDLRRAYQEVREIAEDGR